MKDDTEKSNIDKERVTFSDISEYINMWLDWASYRTLRRPTEYIVKNTDYNEYVTGNSKRPTRFYISRVIFNSILFYFLLVFISFTVAHLYIRGLPTTSIGLLQQFTQVSNLVVLFFGLILSFIEIIIQAVTASAEFAITQDSIQNALGSLVDTLEQIPVLREIIGLIALILIEASTTLQTIDFGQIDFQFSLGELISDISPEDSVVTQIRNISIFVISPLVTLGYIVYKYYIPVYRTNEQERELQKLLPQAYLFLYALSRGGLDVKESMRQLAEMEDTYGEAAIVFQRIIERSEYGSGNLQDSIEKTADNTQIEELKDFLFGLVSVMNTGSDVTRYLEVKSEEALEEKRDKLEGYFSTLEFLSEVYVIVFVVAPIFVIVIVIVSAMTGGFNRGLPQLVPYILIPAGGFLIAALLMVLGQSTTTKNSKIEKPKANYEYLAAKQIDKNIHSQKNADISFSYFFSILNQKPHYSLFLTVPILLFYSLTIFQLGFIPTSETELNENIIEATLFTTYIPMIIILGPWTALYEHKRKRRRRIEKQLPILLENAKEANKRGLSLEESFRVASSSGDTEMLNKLQKSIRVSTVTSNINRSLIEFSNEIKIQTLSQAISIITRATSVSGNIAPVIKTVSEDFNKLYKLEKERVKRAREYVAIIFVSIIVSTLVIIAIQVVFFDFVAGEAQPDEGDAEDVPDQAQADAFEALPEDFFARTLMHILLSLSLVSGIVAGIMENNNPQNGFKYVLILSTLTFGMFALANFMI